MGSLVVEVLWTCIVLLLVASVLGRVLLRVIVVALRIHRMVRRWRLLVGILRGNSWNIVSIVALIVRVRMGVLRVRGVLGAWVVRLYPTSMSRRPLMILTVVETMLGVGFVVISMIMGLVSLDLVRR